MRRILGFALVLGLSGFFPTLAPPYNNAWTRVSAVLTPVVAWEETAVSEPTVLLDGGVWKMWYTGGWTHPGLGYATSSDGITWTKYASNPVYGQGGSGYANTSASHWVTKIDATYYLYTSGGSSTTDARSTFRVATSTDGIAWTTQSSTISLPTGTTLWGNRVVWKEGSSWYLLQEAGLTGGTYWQTWYYTSSDGLTWTIGNSGNALTTLQVTAGGMYGGAHFGSAAGILTPKVGSTYHLWLHAATAAGNLPTDIYHSTSTDRVTWTTPTIVLTHTGAGFEVDQVADPSVVVVGSKAYLFYDGDNNPASSASIGLATGSVTAP